MQNNPICCLQSYPFVVKVIQEEGRHQIQVGGGELLWGELTAPSQTPFAFPYVLHLSTMTS